MGKSERFGYVQGVVIVLVTLAALVLVNLSIIEKERHLAQGQEVLLEMMPVDPRSLMQGDYMRVRFALEQSITTALEAQGIANGFADGVVILRLDEHRIGHFDSVVVDNENMSLLGDEYGTDWVMVKLGCVFACATAK